MSSTMANAGEKLEIKLQQLRELLTAKDIAPQQYAEAVTALEALNAEVKTYYGPRGTDGRRKLLTAEGKTRLIGLYGNAIDRCSALASAGQDDIRKLTQSIGGMLVEDLNIVRQVDPQVGMTLPQAIQDGRAMYVQLSNEQVEAMGGALSSRIPLRIADESGQMLEGFFTQDTVVDPLHYIVDFLQENRTKYPHAAAAFSLAYRNFAARLKAEGLQFDQLKMNNLFLTDMRARTEHKGKKPEEIRDIDELVEMCKYWAPSYWRRAKTAVEEEFSQMERTYASVTTQQSIYQGWLGAEPGDDIGIRNVAMSDLAALLGVPELISHSRPVSVTMDGKTVSGIFMANAHGVDRRNVPGEEHPLRRRSINKQMNDPGMMSVADLAVLDYLGNNVDRHTGNMFFQYDEEGRFVGVEGIDNDAAWGTSDKKGKWGCKLEDLGIITKRMADRVTALDPAMLEYMLRARGLKEDQISGASMRLSNLKQAILEKKVEVLDETQFMERLKTQTVGFGAGKGYFDRVRDNLLKIKAQSIAQDTKSEADPIIRRSGQQKTLDGREKNGELLRALREQQAALEKVDSIWVRSGENFRNMKKALNDACSLAEEYQEIPLDRAGYNRLTRSLKNLKTVTDKYVTDKQKETGRSDYAENRLNYARGLQKFIEAQQKTLQGRLPEVEALQAVRDDRMVARYEREMGKIRRMEQMAGEAGFGEAPKAETDAQRVGKGIRNILHVALSGPADAPSHVNAMRLLIRGFKTLKEMPDGFAGCGLKKEEIADAQKVIQWGRAVEGKKKPAPQAEVELMREAENVINL